MLRELYYDGCTLERQLPFCLQAYQREQARHADRMRELDELLEPHGPIDHASLLKQSKMVEKSSRLIELITPRSGLSRQDSVTHQAVVLLHRWIRTGQLPLRRAYHPIPLRLRADIRSLQLRCN
jgi:hypothetical protein